MIIGNPYRFGGAASYPTDGLVAYYPFSGNSNDESGNSNNSTYNDCTLTSDRNSVANEAYQNPGGKYIAFPGTNFAFGTGSFSFFAYIKQITGTDMVVVSWRPGIEYTFRASNTNFYLYLASTSIFNHYTPESCAYGNYYFCGFTIDKANNKAYIYVNTDKHEFDITGLAGFTGTADLQIFRRRESIEGTGTIDVMYVYNRVLSDAEITILRGLTQ